jgi:hypothetical protein
VPPATNNAHRNRSGETQKRVRVRPNHTNSEGEGNPARRIHQEREFKRERVQERESSREREFKRERVQERERERVQERERAKPI